MPEILTEAQMDETVETIKKNVGPLESVQAEVAMAYAYFQVMEQIQRFEANTNHKEPPTQEDLEEHLITSYRLYVEGMKEDNN